jgi:hypothetical protein
VECSQPITYLKEVVNHFAGAQTSHSISPFGPVEPRRANQLLHGNKIIDILREMRSGTGKPAQDQKEERKKRNKGSCPRSSDPSSGIILSGV